MSPRLLLLLGLSAAVCAIAQTRPPAAVTNATTPPHLKRTAPNLCSDSVLKGHPFWDLGPSAKWDATVSRSPGSKSVKLVSLGKEKGAGLSSGLIKVTPGRTYTFALYMRSGSWPPPVIYLHAGAYDASEKFIVNTGGCRQSPSRSNAWEECVTFLQFPTGTAFGKIKVSMSDLPAESRGEVWVDDVYFGEGGGFEQPPSPKRPFDGSQVRVDALGNVEVLRNGQWTPFFPMCIYGDSNRPDWSVYSQQGFNAEMRAQAAVTVERAKNAKSAFNPDGMMSGFDITGFTNSSGHAYGNLPMLEKQLREVFDRDLGRYLLFYYWDNECYDQWAVPRAVTEKIRQLDLDAHGCRSRPIYILQGNDGIARTYAAEQMTDMVGAYVFGGGAADGVGGLVVLNRIEGQRNPVVVAQMNVGTGRLFRRNLYAAIMQGAKGMGYWRDYYQSDKGKPVESEPWWPDLPNLRREIDQMLPLIRQPHWTTWRIVTATSTPLTISTRDLMGEGYILLANPTDKPVTVQLRFEGLGYSPVALVDYFSDRRLPIRPFMEVTVPDYGSAVYRLLRR